MEHLIDDFSLEASVAAAPPPLPDQEDDDDDDDPTACYNSRLPAVAIITTSSTTTIPDDDDVEKSSTTLSREIPSVDDDIIVDNHPSSSDAVSTIGNDDDAIMTSLHDEESCSLQSSSRVESGAGESSTFQPDWSASFSSVQQSASDDGPWASSETVSVVDQAPPESSVSVELVREKMDFAAELEKCFQWPESAAMDPAPVATIQAVVEDETRSEWRWWKAFVNLEIAVFSWEESFVSAEMRRSLRVRRDEIFGLKRQHSYPLVEERRSVSSMVVDDQHHTHGQLLNPSLLDSKASTTTRRSTTHSATHEDDFVDDDRIQRILDKIPDLTFLLVSRSAAADREATGLA